MRKVRGQRTTTGTRGVLRGPRRGLLTDQNKLHLASPHQSESETDCALSCRSSVLSHLLYLFLLLPEITILFVSNISWQVFLHQTFSLQLSF